MREREPAAARSRPRVTATHQALEAGRVFRDPLAIPILGGEADVTRLSCEQRQAQAGLCFFVAARSRLA